MPRSDAFSRTYPQCTPGTRAAMDEQMSSSNSSRVASELMRSSRRLRSRSTRTERSICSVWVATRRRSTATQISTRPVRLSSPAPAMARFFAVHQEGRPSTRKSSAPRKSSRNRRGLPQAVGVTRQMPRTSTAVPGWSCGREARFFVCSTTLTGCRSTSMTRASENSPCCSDKTCPRMLTNASLKRPLIASE